MTETIEQAAERYAQDKSSSELFRQAHIEDFKAGATWQSSQPNPHRIIPLHVIHLNAFVDNGVIPFTRMVQILNEIAAGKHKERIEL